MDVNPQEWHPPHALESIHVTLDLTGKDGTVVTLSGRSSGKRGALWGHTEVFPLDATRLSMADTLAHLLAVALVDRPSTREGWKRVMVGGDHWEVPELPLGF